MENIIRPYEFVINCLSNILSSTFTHLLLIIVLCALAVLSLRSYGSVRKFSKNLFNRQLSGLTKPIYNRLLSMVFIELLYFGYYLSGEDVFLSLMSICVFLLIIVYFCSYLNSFLSDKDKDSRTIKFSLIIALEFICLVLTVYTIIYFIQLIPEIYGALNIFSIYDKYLAC